MASSLYIGHKQPLTVCICSQDNSGFEFISPLIADMVQDDPGKRPTMDEVVSRFVEIRQNLSDRKLRSRITGREESVFFSACQNLVHWVRSLRYKLQGLPAVPSRSTSGQQHALWAYASLTTHLSLQYLLSDFCIPAVCLHLGLLTQRIFGSCPNLVV
jgi:hypothetical protein